MLGLHWTKASGPRPLDHSRRLTMEALDELQVVDGHVAGPPCVVGDLDHDTDVLRDAADEDGVLLPPATQRMAH